MEAVVEQPGIMNLLHSRHLARTAGHTGRAKAHIVDQYDDDVGGTFGRAQRLDRWEFSIVSIQCHFSFGGNIWDRENLPSNYIWILCHLNISL